MIIAGLTKSVCPVCLRRIDARKVLGNDNNIYMEKECSEHGRFRTLIWEGNLKSYRAWNTENTRRETPVDGKAVSDQGCPYDCGFCSAHLRKGCCVLLELTNRCNLRCPVCFASAGENEPSDLSMEEIGKQYDYLMSPGGPFNIQLSGGEPTMRDDLPEIIRLGREKGFTFFQLNTNGIRLAMEEGYAEILKEAGLNTVFLQFDGVTDEVYRTLRGADLLETKKKAIDICGKAGLGVVLVPVIAPGVNEDQTGEILKLAIANMPAVRGVHFQPVSYFGRCAVKDTQQRITIPKMLRLIEEQTDGIMHAEDYSGGGAENPYCSFHASYLKGKDGKLKPLAKTRSSGCCCSTSSDDSRTFVAEHWSAGSSCCCKDKQEQQEKELQWESLDDFLEHARRNTFSVSGMIFQDAWNFDLDRIQRCYISEMDTERGMIPFCAYNLTSEEGTYLYRR